MREHGRQTMNDFSVEIHTPRTACMGAYTYFPVHANDIHYLRLFLSLPLVIIYPLFDWFMLLQEYTDRQVYLYVPESRMFFIYIAVKHLNQIGHTNDFKMVLAVLVIIVN